MLILPVHLIMCLLFQFCLTCVHCRRSYTDVLKDFFEGEFVTKQNLFSREERYEKILEMIPDECM